MTLPNFLIFGVQKAGTTSIYNYLKQHPQVFMSPLKETDFMGRESAAAPEGAEFEEQLSRGGRKQILTIKDYRELFDGVTDEIAIGEASPNYLFTHTLAVPNIQRHIPNAKLMAVLRNPIERAYSDYLMHVRQVVGNRKPLAEQIQTSGDTSYTLLKGRYYEGVKHFLEVFGPEQVKLFLYEELRNDSAGLMREVYSFIGVDPDFNADTSQKQQKAEIPKNQKLNQLLRTNNPIRSAAGSVLRMLMPEEKRQALRSRLISANSQGKEGMPLSDEDRKLLENYYREDILRLQDLIDRDLSGWFKVTEPGTVASAMAQQ
ncbi:MAG: sulfotransferase [Cyanobacteria bacterium P01_F01_bin.53]